MKHGDIIWIAFLRNLKSSTYETFGGNLYKLKLSFFSAKCKHFSNDPLVREINSQLLRISSNTTGGY